MWYNIYPFFGSLLRQRPVFQLSNDYACTWLSVLHLTSIIIIFNLSPIISIHNDNDEKGFISREKIYHQNLILLIQVFLIERLQLPPDWLKGPNWGFKQILISINYCIDKDLAFCDAFFFWISFWEFSEPSDWHDIYHNLFLPELWEWGAKWICYVFPL